MAAETNRPTRSMLSLVAALAAVTVCALVAQPASAAAPRSFYGISPQTGLASPDLDRMGQAKVGTIRVPIFWFVADPAAPAGGYDFTQTDQIVRDAARNGIKVLPFLYGSPSWVATSLNGSSCSDCSTTAPVTPAALDAWADFVGATVARYGSTGTFWTENPSIPKEPIEAYQLWNEQNSKSFFAPKAKAKLYAKMLAAGADAVRAVDPSADVVIGGMPQLAGSKKAIPGSEYLADLYDVSGAKKNFDGVAIHPYGSSVKKVAEQVDLFTDEMKAAGDKKAELWVTEIGAGSATGGNPLNRGKKGQAKLLKDSYKYFAKQRNKLNIPTVIWFSWMDAQIAICDWCKTSGLLTLAGGEKPAFKAFTKFTRGS